MENILTRLHREPPETKVSENGHAKKVDVKSLERDLKKNLIGEVRFDTASIGLYATDSSNFREVPLGVVVPKTLNDVVAAHRICAQYGAPICNRGTGTSLSGETVNFAVIIDNSKYLTHIGETDTERKLVTVQTGAINEKVNESTGKQNLVFGPDPSTHAYCTIGGNVGNNSCGIHSVQSQIFGPGPRTSDNVYAMDIVLYGGERFRVGVNEEPELDRIIAAGGRKGEIYGKLRALRDRYADLIRQKFPPVTKLPRRVSGYNLDELLPERGFNVARALVGTEGTCATALEVTLLLTPAMLKRISVVVEYGELPEAAEHIGEIMEWKPIALEAVDHQLFEHEKLEHMEEKGLEELPRSGKGSWLLIEFGGENMDEVRDHSYRFRDWLVEKKHYAKDRIRIFENDKTSKLIWKVREGGLGATAFPPNGKDHWPGWEDSAVPPDKVSLYLRDLKKLYDKFGLNGAIYGHFGQGCIHSRISFDLRSLGGVRQYRKFLDEASDLVVAYGGSLSGEHGDGQQRAEFLHKQYGPELVEAMCEFKRIWDPQWKMNPGKVVHPYPVDSFLKLRNFHPEPVKTKFAYPDDHNDFSHAAIRCVGVGKCRQPDGVDVMCPSYIVTREEKHSTRGRARLLFEMLQGNVIKDGWQSKEVNDALDLCLGCKGCTSDCPVHVDMPTYKAEFLYHHYQSPKRFRKRYMYAFGFIDKFARLGSLLPEAINFFAKTPGFSHLAKLVTGMDRHREIPQFAPLSLQSWFRRRGGSKVQTGPPVILWPDTFNNYFHTDVGTACVEALESAGYKVLMPMQHVCCGRPLYDYGFLDQAEKYLRRTIALLRDEIRMGIPFIGMEPSCLAVFKDELTKLLPNDPDAAQLKKNSYHWAEFFQKHEIKVPRLDGKALMWGHCHHKATGGMEPEKKFLQEQMGLEVEEAKGGCCGLAGSWGFETGKYDISMQCAEVGFLPAIRQAEKSTVIVANGFSCKTQLEQSGVGRHALHLAEVMRIARKSGSHRLHAQMPELLRDPKPPAPPEVKAIRVAAVIGLSALAIFAARKMLNRKPKSRRIKKAGSKR